jgi:hypothetical protein
VELLVRDAAGVSTGDDFVEWAVRALVEGFDSPGVRWLAGFAGAARFEAKAVFDRVVGELSLAVPATRDALLRAYLAVLAGDIVNGTRHPGEALDVIHREVIGPLNHPADLMEWCYAWEHLDPARGFASLSDAERDDAARELARRTLEKGGGQS